MTRQYSVFLLFLVVIFAAASAQMQDATDARSIASDLLTRQDIERNMEKRKQQLETMIRADEEKLKSHKDGRTVMSDEDYQRIEKRIELVQRKLDRVTNLDDHDIERHRRREQRRNERRQRRDRGEEL
mmetsp:Transcript_19950/g.29552  ORF Transcript_19950/g.29552 Transcript_19950/m.29552 type:complete len:128 (-) Transcript_19950:116-499(-)|eukprot:CAMPEP_0194031552 /NCGR_PEP_ID=MMETSP0009_2-20130614/4711_1 /TAXON_ID=210454 /ORGANISM="Grammatophora oceanica, Strain CCMP 410" /LENGTH=127 /DNA_ID=CAMNT_0038671751 /DNA_START=22 /DNA_END=405 /DNA_ORIENTATION=+